MNILFTDQQKALSISPETVKRLIRSFLSWKSVFCDEVIVHFVDKQIISHLHKEFFNDPTPTDCISFPIDSPKKKNEGYTILGEVFVCPQMGVEYAERNNMDPYEEVSLYLIHGLLHLLGFDDLKEKDKMIMQGEENSAIEYLKKNKGLLT